MSASALEGHLACCVNCAAWLEAATRAGRALRVSGVTPPDLSATILDEVMLPAARLSRRRRWLRVGLAMLGFVQWALVMPALFGDSIGVHGAMVMSTHAVHESVAWNLAMGASFLAIAVKPGRAVGTVPILTTFVVVLAVLSVPDVITGAVGPARLASHLGVVAGLLLVALLSRAERLPSPGSVVQASDGAGLRRDRRERGAA